MPGARLHPIQETVELIRKGIFELSLPGEKALQRIKQHQGLNAFTYVASAKDVQQNLKHAEHRDQNGKNTTLLGIPVAVKDNFCYKGKPTTCGSKMLMNFKAPYTATVVRKLMDAGAVVVGKTNMDEFGMGNGTLDSIFGATKNIWGLDSFANKSKRPSDWYVPGGSSGGSAVAVATGICHAAIGSDTGGSTRNPAAYCGVVGLKPTYGRLSRWGLIPLVNSMDVPGILTRTVEDCTVVFNALQGFDPKDSTSVHTHQEPVSLSDFKGVKGINVGLPMEYITSDLSPEVVECWKYVASLLTEDGANVKEVSLPHTRYSIACYSVLNPCEVASNMARYDGLKYGHRTLKPEAQNSTEALYAQTRQEAFNTVVRGRILTGNYFLLRENYEKYFSKAMRIRRLISQDFDNVWSSGTQVLLAPVTLTAAPTYSEFTQWDNRKQSSVQDYCTQSANMAGIPAISIPIKLNVRGLPLAVQLMGPHFSEEMLLNVARQIESRVSFQHIHAR